MPDRPFNVSTLFADLGWDIQGSDLDEAVRWALVELYLRRQGKTICNKEFQSRRCTREVGHSGLCCDAEYCICDLQ